MGPGKNMTVEAAVTPSLTVLPDKPKGRLNKTNFDTLVHQKGYPIYIDKAMKCPCASEQAAQGLPGCRNCGGSGYIYYNRIETHAIIHSINLDTKFKEWSEDLIGTASLTTYHEIRLSYMDRIRLREGFVVYNELLRLKKYDDDEWRCGVRYPPLEVETAFLFENHNQKLTLLERGVDFELVNNVFRVLSSGIRAKIAALPSPTVSLRYTHRPEFVVIDIPRNTISSLSIYSRTETEQQLLYPVHAVVRVPHYVLDVTSNDGTYLFDNSYGESGCATGITPSCP